MAKYKLSAGGVIDQESGSFIPETTANRDWRAYQDWLAMGNTPDPESTPEEIAEQERLERQETRTGTLKSAVIDMFDMILSLFQVGRTKGLWTVADFPADIVTKAQEWRTIVDAYRVDEV